MSQTELANLAGTGGLIVSLIWAVKYLTARWETSQSKVIVLLETTIAQNTAALLRVENVLTHCRAVQNAQEKATSWYRESMQKVIKVKPELTP